MPRDVIAVQLRRDGDTVAVSAERRLQVVDQDQEDIGTLIQLRLLRRREQRIDAGCGKGGCGEKCGVPQVLP
jgi:hypothetical protein